MGFMTTMATELNLIGKFIYNVLYGWVTTWNISDTAIVGAFGVTVILFTVFLKLALSPLDIWQKQLTRKNAKIMKAMKPELEKLQKQYKNDQNQLMLKQRALNKKYKYSPFKACLPTLVTLIVFMVVFSGFRSAVTYHNSVVYDEVREAHKTTFATVYEEEYDAQILQGKAEDAAKAAAREEATKKADEAALAAYKMERFLLTKNIFTSDNWASPVPTAEDFAGTGLGKMGIQDIDGEEYSKVMSAIINEYNVNSKGKSTWNGYLLLPILALLLNLLSMKFLKPAEQPQVVGQTEEQKKSQAASMKMMQWTMPILTLVFSVFYSSAFTVYMLVNSLITLIFNLVFNAITKKKDEREEDEILSKTKIR